MIDSLIILYLLAVHFVADFLFQSHYMSINKSKDNRVLLWHVGIYSLTMYVGAILLGLERQNQEIVISALAFSGWLFMSHLITDYFTSRWTSRLYKQERWHDFFCVIGFDQLLHAAQIIVGYCFILML